MEKVRRISGVVLICCLILIGISKLGYLVRPTDTDGAYAQIETFHSLPENSLEVIAYGSSHAFRGLSTMEMYKQYGIGAYNYSWHWQKINTSKLFLKDSLLTQKPKVILFEAFQAGNVLQDTDVTAEIYYCNYIYDKKAKKDYLKQCLGEKPSLDRRLSYVMPLAMFHNNWNSLDEKSFKRLVPGANSSLLKTMGYSSSEKVTPVNIPDYKTFEQKELGEAALKELQDIVAICQENDIEIVFYTVPWEGEYAFREAMTKFASANDCVYLDLFERNSDIGLDGNTDFSDEGHLNRSGSEKVADYLGKYLVDHYDLTDMRTIEGNLWERQLQ